MNFNLNRSGFLAIPSEYFIFAIRKKKKNVTGN